MEQEIYSETKNRMEKTIEHYKKELSSIRTGRASGDILNPIKIDYYGSPTPLNNIANITTPEAQLILVQPFDPSSLELIEKAIADSDLGLTPNNDGNAIRLNIPSLTEDRRIKLQGGTYNGGARLNSQGYHASDNPIPHPDVCVI